jgi:mannose-6-phosphate isomerase-like protein (cupin superfamily)
MQIRRVVTGHGPGGKSRVASDEMVDGLEIALAPGMVFHRLWGSDERPVYPDAGSPAPAGAYFPPENGFRFVAFTVPPESSAAPAAVDDIATAVAEAEQKLPGLLAHMEPDDPGFHTTDTVDLFYIASGRILSRLDDGVEVELKAGDTFVQSGTRHAWRNPGSEPATLVGAIVGASRK